jgi:RNA polymerase sigma-70 factor (ECF subfamily)
MEGDSPLLASVRAVTEAKNAWVERLFAAHRGALQAFFYRRVRFRADATDLAQEVYVRMLRVKDMDSIRDTEAYLYTVAGNLAKEHAAREQRRGIAVDVEETKIQEELAELASFDAQIDVAQQVKQLREVLRQLPPRWHAAVMLHYVRGLSYDEVAQQLGVSTLMVKKYLGKALGHCRRRMVRPGLTI